ncbi:hypothetical protein ESCO106014_24570 [Escherichia coli]
MPSILNLPLALVPSTVAPLSAIRAPPDVMVTSVALPPADTARVPPSSTRVFCAEWPSSTSRRPPDSRTTPSALPFSTVKLPRRLLPRTVAAVLVTSAPPCFRVTCVAVPPAFTCSLPFWLTVVKSARPPSLIICQPSLFTTVPDAVPPLCTYWYPPFSVVSSA